MPIFQKSAQDEQRFAEFLARVDKAKSTLEPYSDYADLSQLDKVRDSFVTKTEDFFRNDRKLNIGVIGQVKAGKSSFLNTLLFGGKKVLPSAATPKTATLTKIEYSEENKLIVEYYNEGEWAILQANAKVDSEENEYTAAREIMKMAAENGLNPAEYISRGSDEFAFVSAEELMDKLDSYVGECGKYTALVKNVTICINNPELKDISVVDTPGLNDAIASRTDKTRQFIGDCDVVFFLSRASWFLDSSDIRLLTTQIPQKGVSKLVLIASCLDSGLQDELEDKYDSITEATEGVTESLRKRAAAIIKSSKIPPMLAEIIRPCEDPIFVSSMCWNMSRKTKSDYTRQEKLIFDNLDVYDDVDNDTLRRIGNIESVEKVFNSVVAEKDEILAATVRNLVPNYEIQLNSVLTDYTKRAEKSLEILKTGDKEELQKQKKLMSSQINGVKGSVETVFGEMLAAMERAKMDTLAQLREASRDAATLADKTGTETHVTSYKVSDFDMRHPFKTWGKSHREYSTYETTYTYLDASDALENIRCFSADACSYIERAFYTTVDITGTKRRLLSVVIENFDTSSELYDPALFRLITEQTLNQVVFPVMKLDVSAEQQALSSRFSGEIRDSGDRSELRKLLSDTVGKLLDVVTDKFEREIASFRGEIEKLKNTFAGQLLENIEADFNKLLEQLENKQNEIQNYEHLLTLLRQVK